MDPSAAMLGRAEDLLAAEPTDVRSRVSLVQADGVNAPDALSGRRFDAVLCHGVIMYVDDPEPFVSALVALAKPGAMVSIVAKNARTLAVRPALAGDWEQALASFDATRQINGLDVDTRGDTVESLSAILTKGGAQPVAWYGVRLFTDGWTRDRPSEDADDDVLAVELEASRRDPYRQLSRLFHLVARKS